MACAFIACHPVKPHTPRALLRRRGSFTDSPMSALSVRDRHTYRGKPILNEPVITPSLVPSLVFRFANRNRVRAVKPCESTSSELRWLEISAASAFGCYLPIHVKPFGSGCPCNARLHPAFSWSMLRRTTNHSPDRSMIWCRVLPMKPPPRKIT